MATLRPHPPDPAPFRLLRAEPRGVVRDVREAVEEHELLTRASAIAFQLLTAIVPFLLFLVGLLGYLGLEDVYRREVAPVLQRDLKPNAFGVLDSTLRQVLGSGSLFWITAGLAIAIWQLSGGVRAAAAALDCVHHGPDRRPLREVLTSSILLAAAVLACVVAALALAFVVPLAVSPGGPLGVLVWLVRMGVAAALLLLAVGLVVHYAPAEPQPLGWVSVGAVLVTAGWFAVTGAFALYLTTFASSGSIYGAFTSVVVGLAWCYVSALTFVIGIATDAVLRGRSTQA